METKPWSRLPARAIASLALGEAPSVISLSVAGALYASQPSLWPGTIALYLIGALLVLRLARPLYDWGTVSFSITDEDFSLTRGLLRRETRTVAWRDVSAVNIGSPWALRWLGLSEVSLRSGGQDGTRIDVSAVGDDVVDTMVKFVRDCRPLATETSTRQQAAKSPAETTADGSDRNARRLVYMARRIDLATANLVYGQALVLGVGVLVVGVEVLDSTNLIDEILGFLVAQPALIGLLLVVVVLIGGSIMGLVRFYGFKVSQDEHSVYITYGMLSTTERGVRLSTVIGVMAHRNVVEMLLDRVRISLLTVDSDALMGTNIVLPSLPRSQVSVILDASMAQWPRPELLARAGRRSLPRSAALVLLVTFLAVLAGWGMNESFDAHPFVSLVVAAAVWVVSAAMVRLLRGRFSVSREAVNWGADWMTDREIILLSTSVHAVSGFRTFAGPMHLVRVYYFAGQCKSLNAVVSSSVVLEKVSSLLEENSPRIAASRQWPVHQSLSTEECARS